VRELLLFLSRQARLRRWVETSALARRLSSRFVAGETLAEALTVARRVNSEGISVTLDHLGENVSSLEEAAASRDEYIRALDQIQALGLNANVSIKLTQFGIDLDEAICRANVEQLVKVASQHGSFVRVDMESSEYTDRTLRLVTDLHTRHKAVGAVIQAYLHRTRADVEEAVERGDRVRLCKGAYKEPPEVALQVMDDIRANYKRCADLLLDKGNYPAMATHDEGLVRYVLEYTKERKIPSERFEFQMLYGLRPGRWTELVAAGHKMRVYVPYGAHWFPYFYRRLRERKENVLFVLRGLFD
jgi:proline dehydrogenase